MLWRDSGAERTGRNNDFIRQQVKVGFQNVTADQAKTAVIAYEPIWAIGTGKQLQQSRLRKFAKESVSASLKFMMKLQQKQFAFSTADL